MGKVKNLRKAAKELGMSELPRFTLPTPEEFAKQYPELWEPDKYEILQGYNQLLKMKPTRRALLALLGEKIDMKGMRLVRDKFIPLEMQHRYYTAVDSESLPLDQMGELPDLPESWNYSLKHSYHCVINGYGPGRNGLTLWTEQIAKGRTKTEQSCIFLNMSKALAIAECPYDG